MSKYLIIPISNIETRIKELQELSNQPAQSVYDMDIDGFVLDELQDLLDKYKQIDLSEESINNKALEYYEIEYGKVIEDKFNELSDKQFQYNIKECFKTALKYLKL